MLGPFIEGFWNVMSFPEILYLIIGTVLGLVFGAVPGLGGAIAIALLIPLTFWMNSIPAMILFGATIGGVAFGGSISAILINTPGTAPNAASCFDGYPLARNGRANEALGISATASLLGAIFGLLILFLLIPVSREIILSFGPTEFFWLAILGLSTVAVSAKGHLLKGLAAGGFGLMLSFIGYSSVSAEYRYGFDTTYLYDGLDFVVVLVGLFGIAELIRLTIEKKTIDQSNQVEKGGKTLKGVKQVISRPYLFFRSAALGTLIGIVPGAGGTVANFLSYIQARSISNSPETFGEGNPEGLIASEAANDSKDGGALLPTIVFGIPGSATTAVLLGGLVLHGLTPGRQMLGEGLPLLFTLLIALLLSNIITSIVGLLVADHLSKVTRIRPEFIAPGILVVCLFGGFAIRNQLMDVLLVIIAGIFGYLMINYNYPRVAIVLALILGPIMETQFHIALDVSGGDYGIFFTRPISILLIALTVIALGGPFARKQIQQRGEQA